jgi:hypothetical protein
MIAALEAFVLLVVLAVAFLLYRTLIRSKWFSRLVGETKPLPESSEEVIGRMDEAEARALRAAIEAEDAAERDRKTAATIRKRTRRVVRKED